ncbi:caspase family protein [Amycolatopsis acidiphila]|uniref:Caspase family protein n=1 Tax=Amycolatopsis acidiphila TaxID=715473 RepID=A0A558A6Y6_9PSEU|nr:caspase family protein [Amycolatopsis acidiphila]TVT20006.1 caspase family protein [Amycolatopsis acidiphila]UIJ63469.1 caspase family protein [Amycolatopsis acidiphila]GHG68750.1 hypothetical protein GCM10017788_28770 [Amycolatopsis acidiphila]
MNPDEEKADPSRSSALLIGGKTYQGSNLTPVPAVEDNLAKLKAAFSDSELWGLPRTRLTAEIDLKRSDMLDAIGLHYRLSERGGTFVLYFVGHAHFHDGMLYLAPYDTGDRANPEASMVPMSAVFAAVEREGKRAERKLLILDCCYAGGAVRSVPGEPSTAGAEHGWYVMAATSDNDIAFADSGRETTFFTGALLKAFEGVEATQPSLSAKWVFETVSKVIEGVAEPKFAPQPHESPFTWADRPWLRNRQHVPPSRVPYVFPSLAAETITVRQPLPNGFRPWPIPEVNFVGRTQELEAALSRFRQRTVLPVNGPRYAGKAAFVRQFLATCGVKEAAPTEQPWLLLEITIVNRSAESPVLEALASALEIRLQDIDQSTEADGDPRRELVIDRLREHARGRTLLLVIDCGRLGYDSAHIRSELDQLLAHAYFRDTANIVISRAPLTVHGDEQLDLQVPIQLKELEQRDAAELLTALISQERQTVDGEDVLGRIQDRWIRLPGVLKNSVYGYLSRVGDGVTTPDPGHVAAALMEGTTPSVARTLKELDCRLITGTETPVTPEPLAILAVWALSDQLSVSQHVLEAPSVGFPHRTLALLEDARVVSSTDSGALTLGQASEQALRSLVTALLTRGEAVEDPLAPVMLDPELLDHLFPAELDIAELDRRFAMAATSLLVTAAGALDVDTDNASDAFEMKLRSALGWIEDEGGDRLPALHDVICSLVVAPAGDAPYLPAMADRFVQEAEERAVSESLTNARAADDATPLAGLYRLYNALTSLTFAARVEGAAAENSARFVAAAEEFSAALGQCDPAQVQHTLLRSADASLAVTGKRLRLRARLIDVRLAAVDALLLGARRPGGGQAGRITLAVSWLLNTADALIDADRGPEAEQLVATAAELVADELPHDGTTRSVYSRLQLGNRIARVRSRLLPDPADGRRELVEAVRFVIAGLELAHEEGVSLTPWSMRLFESGTLLLQQSSTDEELVEVRALVLDSLARCWGDWRSWPSSICIASARFLRKVHVRCADVRLKLSGAKEAVELLVHHAPGRDEQAVATGQGNSQPRLEPRSAIASLDKREHAKVLAALAQAYGFLARACRDDQDFPEARAALTKAEEHARAAVELAPAAFSYSVWLRQVLDVRRSAPRTGAAGEAAERQRRACVKAIRNWLRQADSRSHAHAALDLSCLESDWAEEGSLRGAAKRAGEEDFLRRPPAVQRERIEALYRERRQKLRAHRYRYGPSIELCALETRLEREYCRWTAVLGFKLAKWEKNRHTGPGPTTRRPQVDNTPVLEIFHEASRLWPEDARLIAAEAGFRRYIWDYEEAINLYERLARTAPNGDMGRVALLSAAEAMLAEAEYADADRRPDRHDRLIDAKDHLNTVLSGNRRIWLALVLSGRVAIRLREPLNWAPIDSSFEVIIGGDYTGTVGRFLDRRRYGEARSLDTIGDRIRNKGGDKPPERARRNKLLDDLLDGEAASESASGTSSTDSVASPQLSASDTYVRDEDLEQLTPDLLGELLLAEFTSVPLLEGLGKLYLDRAIDLANRHGVLHGVVPPPNSSTAEEAADHARRAYDCFDACRVLQEAHGAESIVTKFERGRAITLAAKFVHNPNPFPQSVLQGRGEQIKQAVNLLLAAREHSVGKFNSVCSRAVAENNDLQARLGLRKPIGGQAMYPMS